MMPCFLIKKNATSTQNPWLGVIPKMSQQELFGKITDILGSGGYLKAFYSAEEAFDHIREHYPKDVGQKQVYELIEEDGLELKLIPWI